MNKRELKASAEALLVRFEESAELYYAALKSLTVLKARNDFIQHVGMDALTAIKARVSWLIEQIDKLPEPDESVNSKADVDAVPPERRLEQLLVSYAHEERNFRGRVGGAQTPGFRLPEKSVDRTVLARPNEQYEALQEVVKLFEPPISAMIDLPEMGAQFLALCQSFDGSPEALRVLEETLRRYADLVKVAQQYYLAVEEQHENLTRLATQLSSGTLKEAKKLATGTGRQEAWTLTFAAAQKLLKESREANFLREARTSTRLSKDKVLKAKRRYADNSEELKRTFDEVNLLIQTEQNLNIEAMRRLDEDRKEAIEKSAAALQGVYDDFVRYYQQATHELTFGVVGATVVQLDELKKIADTCFSEKMAPFIDSDKRSRLSLQAYNELKTNRLRDLTHELIALRDTLRTPLRASLSAAITTLKEAIQGKFDELPSLTGLCLNFEEMGKYRQIEALNREAQSLVGTELIALTTHRQRLEEIKMAIEGAVEAFRFVLEAHRNIYQRITNCFVDHGPSFPDFNLVSDVNRLPADDANVLLNRVGLYSATVGEQAKETYWLYLVQNLGRFSGNSIAGLEAYIKDFFPDKYSGSGIGEKLTFLRSLHEANPPIDHRVFFDDTASFRSEQMAAVKVLKDSGLLQDPNSVKLGAENLQSEPFCRAICALQESGLFESTEVSLAEKNRLVTSLKTSPQSTSVICKLQALRHNRLDDSGVNVIAADTFLSNDTNFKRLMAHIAKLENPRILKAIGYIVEHAPHLFRPSLIVLFSETIAATKEMDGLCYLLNEAHEPMIEDNMLFLITALDATEVVTLDSFSLGQYFEDVSGSRHKFAFPLRMGTVCEPVVRALVDMNTVLVVNDLSIGLLKDSEVDARNQLHRSAQAMQKINAFTWNPPTQFSTRILQRFRREALPILLTDTSPKEKIKNLDALAKKEFKGDKAMRAFKDVLTVIGAILTLGLVAGIHHWHRESKGKTTFFRLSAAIEQERTAGVTYKDAAAEIEKIEKTMKNPKGPRT